MFSIIKSWLSYCLAFYVLALLALFFCLKHGPKVIKIWSKTAKMWTKTSQIMINWVSISFISLKWWFEIQFKNVPKLETDPSFLHHKKLDLSYCLVFYVLALPTSFFCGNSLYPICIWREKVVKIFFESMIGKWEKDLSILSWLWSPPFYIRRWQRQSAHRVISFLKLG